MEGNCHELRGKLSGQFAKKYFESWGSRTRERQNTDRYCRGRTGDTEITIRGNRDRQNRINDGESAIAGYT